MLRFVFLMVVGVLLVDSPAAKAAQSVEYECLAQNWHRSTLVLQSDGRGLVWSNHSSAAQSRGVFSHVETALYAETRGYFLFSLLDYYRTSDSEFVLALDPGFRRGGRVITVVEYFDNDDHSEDVTSYTCHRIR